MVNNVQITKASISFDFLEILLPLIKKGLYMYHINKTDTEMATQ